jgi:hypothetical protein
MNRTVKDEHTYEYVIESTCKYGCSSHTEGEWYESVNLGTTLQRDQARNAFEALCRKYWKATYRLVERVTIHKVTVDIMEEYQGILENNAPHQE